MPEISEYTIGGPNFKDQDKLLEEQKAFGSENIAQIEGGQSAAAKQMQMGLGQAAQQAQGQAVSRGSNPLAQRAAAYSQGQMGQQAVTQAAQMQAQESAQARQAQLANLQNLGAAQFGQEQMLLDREMAQAQQHTASQDLEIKEEGQDFDQAMQGVGTALDAAGTIGSLAAGLSDERMKQGISSGGGGGASASGDFSGSASAGAGGGSGGGDWTKELQKLGNKMSDQGRAGAQRWTDMPLSSYALSDVNAKNAAFNAGLQAQAARPPAQGAMGAGAATAGQPQAGRMQVPQGGAMGQAAQAPSVNFGQQRMGVPQQQRGITSAPPGPQQQGMAARAAAPPQQQQQTFARPQSQSQLGLGYRPGGGGAFPSDERAKQEAEAEGFRKGLRAFDQVTQRRPLGGRDGLPSGYGGASARPYVADGGGDSSWRKFYLGGPPGRPESIRPYEPDRISRRSESDDQDAWLAEKERELEDDRNRPEWSGRRSDESDAPSAADIIERYDRPRGYMREEDERGEPIYDRSRLAQGSRAEDDYRVLVNRRGEPSPSVSRSDERRGVPPAVRSEARGAASPREFDPSIDLSPRVSGAQGGRELLTRAPGRAERPFDPMLDMMGGGYTESDERAKHGGYTKSDERVKHDAYLAGRVDEKEDRWVRENDARRRIEDETVTGYTGSRGARAVGLEDDERVRMQHSVPFPGRMSLRAQEAADLSRRTAAMPPEEFEQRKLREAERGMAESRAYVDAIKSRREGRELGRPTEMIKAIPRTNIPRRSQEEIEREDALRRMLENESGRRVYSGAASPLRSTRVVSLGDLSEDEGQRAGYYGGDDPRSHVPSDERSKSRPRQLSPEDEDELLEKLDGYLFEYKPEAQELYGVPPGPRVGVMAQDLERADMGKPIVKENEDGIKMLDRDQVQGATLALLGRLNERMERLEERRG